MVLSDTTNMPALFAKHPNWHGAVDADPVLAEATRRKLFDRVVAEGARYRLPFPVPGRWQDRDGWRGLHLRACCIETAIIPQPVAVFDTLFRSAKLCLSAIVGTDSRPVAEITRFANGRFAPTAAGREYFLGAPDWSLGVR